MFFFDPIGGLQGGTPETRGEPSFRGESDRGSAHVVRVMLSFGAGSMRFGMPRALVYWGRRESCNGMVYFFFLEGSANLRRIHAESTSLVAVVGIWRMT